jgi:hypothetical protein
MRSSGLRPANSWSRCSWCRSASLRPARGHGLEATLQLGPTLLFPLVVGVVERLMEPQPQLDHGEPSHAGRMSLISVPVLSAAAR